MGMSAAQVSSRLPLSGWNLYPMRWGKGSEGLVFPAMPFPSRVPSPEGEVWPEGGSPHLWGCTHLELNPSNS